MRGMAVEGPSSFDKVKPFPESPTFLREAENLIKSTRDLIEQRYSSLYLGTLGSSSNEGAAPSKDKKSEKEALAEVKAMCDELETAKKDLETDKLDRTKLAVAKDAKKSLETALEKLMALA